MANKKLSDLSIREIRSAMDGLTGKDAKKEAERLAELHTCSWQHIYELTKDLRAGSRKPRADKGKRKWKLVEGTDVWIAAQYVVVDKYDPNLALEQAELRGHKDLPGLYTFQALLRENGLSRKQRKSGKRPHVRFEAEFPGQIYQVDATGLKKRWLDLDTRSVLQIEGIDKNHPNLDAKKERVWQLMLVDDFSRRHFLRYVHATAITSTHLVHFLCEAFEIMGVCQKLYADNGSEFKKRHLHAEKILNKILENEGGYVYEPHLPGNAQATGKVERAHQWAEKMDKLVGAAISEGQEVNIEILNVMADRICTFYNEARIHRGTGQKPMDRWFAKRTVIRRLPAEIIKAALLSEEFEVTLNHDMTVSREGDIYQIPGKQPFVNYAGEKVWVVIPPEIDVMLITLPDNSTHEIPKVLFAPQTAGEFASYEENQAQHLTKRLKETRLEERRAIKKQKKLTGEIAPIPFFNTEVETPKDNQLHFPHRERIMSPEDVVAAAPGTVPPSLLSAKQISYWKAVATLADRFTNPEECREFLLTIFGSDDAELPLEEVTTAIDDREEKVSHLKAV